MQLEGAVRVQAYAEAVGRTRFAIYSRYHNGTLKGSWVDGTLYVYPATDTTGRHRRIRRLNCQLTQEARHGEIETTQEDSHTEMRRRFRLHSAQFTNPNSEEKNRWRS